SRRRHTRSKRDWSSDVCSSDLLDELYGEVDDFLDEVTYEFGEGLELLPEGEYIEVIPAVEEDPFKIENPLLSAEKRVEKLYGIRSEERRVGKEGRAREARDDEG